MAAKTILVIIALSLFFQFFNRLFKKVMYNRLQSFFNKYNVLYESQYGFRERRSTDHAILDNVNKIQSYMDKGMFSCGVFIDLQKAFDTVDHAILYRSFFTMEFVES